MMTEEQMVAQRPSMESVIARYSQMRAEMFAALAEAFGEAGWADAPNSPGWGRSSAGSEDTEAEAVGFVTQSFTGTYPVGQWHSAAALVGAVGKRYGFEDVTVVADSPGDLTITGEDALGGRYTFGMAVNTIFSLRTGAHRWDTPPASA